MSNTKGRKLYIGVIVIVAVIVFGVVSHAHAASLYFSPSSRTYTSGERFTVKVLVESASQAMNAAAVDISFPPRYLELTSVSRSNSIIDFWTEEPSFSNKSGAVSFEGVDLQGYQGGSGELVTLVFRARRNGQAALRFVSGNVLADDGLGTALPTSLRQANFTFISAPTPPPEEEVLIPVPVVSSPTHPDQTAWYSDSAPRFEWDLPDTVIDVDVFISGEEAPSFDEDYEGRGLIDHIELIDIAEGRHTIHAIFKTDDGWGESSAFRFNIDTEPPEHVNIQEVYRSERADGRAEFTFEAEDKTSGISHYRVFIDDDYVEDWFETRRGRYQTPLLQAGTHTLTIEAIDHAGNIGTDFIAFRIPFPLFLILVVLAGLILLILLIQLYLGYKRYAYMKRVHTGEDRIQVIAELARKYRDTAKDEKNLLENIDEDLSHVDKRIHRDMEKIKQQLGKNGKQPHKEEDMNKHEGETNVHEKNDSRINAKRTTNKHEHGA